MRQQLEGIESGYETLNQLLTTGCTYLPQSEREEEHQRLKRLADNVATLLKVHTEGPRQRFADAASQTQPRDPDWRGVSPGREAAGETESQGPTGREPGSEPAAEKQEETRSHVGHVCEESQTPKYGLDQTSLDSRVHRISDTTEAEEYKTYSATPDAFKSSRPGLGQAGTDTPLGMETPLLPQVDVKGLVSRFEKPTCPAPSEVPVGRQKNRVSPARQGAAQTESGADTGRKGQRSEKPKSVVTCVHTKANRPPVPPKSPVFLLLSGKHQQVDATLSSASLQDLTSAGAAREPGRSRQDSVSPAGHVALPPELRECADKPQAELRWGRAWFHAVDVTLDPNTAHPNLILSADRKQVRHGDTCWTQSYNSEQFDRCVSVLGAERFTGGKRYWEVEVGDKTGWALGVCRESANRKGKVSFTPENGYWAVWLKDGNYLACTSPETSLPVSARPSRVGIFLHCEASKVSFYNVTDGSQLFAFTDTFSGTLRPFFNPGLNAGGRNAAPLSICPVPSRAGGTLHPCGGHLRVHTGPSQGCPHGDGVKGRVGGEGASCQGHR
ncbi:uncharacterized protein LOC142823141 [Pelodiscus sinensis]|uniref:uncharacterized protein LOC142823141 n=1 Tax=Pelodiscus sinensis TaxID=13735 RepID=UPI003F6D29F4